MKRTLLIIVTLVISITAFSQEGNSTSRTPLQRVILDVGAVPYEYTINGAGYLRSVNLGIGYEISKRLDLRLNLDFNTFYDMNELGIPSPDFYRNMRALSIGASYSVLNDFKLIYSHSQLDLSGKFGIDINDHSEQESIFYDISARLKFKDIPYVGIGFNHHIFDTMFNSDFSGLYLTIGLEF